jgi:hypothetical protein
MNDFPKPSAPAGISGPVVEVEIPSGMFFEAKDYAPHAKPRTKQTKDQSNVARSRNEQISNVARLHERLATALRHVRVADECGMVTSSIDVLVATAEDFLANVRRMAKAADNAEARFEEAIEKGPEAPPADGSINGATIVGGAVQYYGYNQAKGLSQIAGYIDGLAVPASPLLTPEATARIRAAQSSRA